MTERVVPCAVHPQRVKFVEDDLRGDCDEGVVLQEIDERGQVRLREPQLAVDVLNARILNS